MSHRDSVTAAPPGFAVLAASGGAPRRRHGGPASAASTPCSSTPRSCTRRAGMDILRNFLYDVCGCAPDVDDGQHHRGAVEQHPRAGGATPRSSAACPAAWTRAVAAAAGAPGHRRPAHVRVRRPRHAALDEAEQVVDMFRDAFRIPLIARRRQATASSTGSPGVTDPERKRKIIGEEFMPSASKKRRASSRTPSFLAQGTLYPDVIESGTRQAAKIKSHHNVGGAAREDGLRAGRAAAAAVQGRGARGRRGARPARARSSGGSRSPGPASAIRIIGEITPSGWTSCSAPTRSCTRRSANAGLYRELWQCFAVLPGDPQRGRAGRRAHLRATRSSSARSTSDDAMTADWARLPYELLAKISQPHHQRGARGQPRRLRHHEQAAEHHRVGVSVSIL